MIAEPLWRMLSNATGWDGAHPQDPVLKKIFGVGAKTKAGVSVDENSALSDPAFWRGVNLLASSVAKTPAVVYERTADGGKRKATEHPAYVLLRHDANPEQSASVVKRTLMGHVLTYGSGYNRIFRKGNGQPEALVPLLPDRTFSVRIEGGRLMYVTNIGGREIPLLPEDVIHMRGLSFDGLGGYKVVELGKEVLGFAMGAREFTSRFIGQGMNASGFVKMPEGLEDEEADERFVKSFREAQSGLGESHKWILLEEAMEFTQTQIDAEKSQLNESRDRSLVEVALLTGAPPHKVGDRSRTSFKSLEEENRSYASEGVDPWFCIFEDEYRKKLLTEKEKRDDTHVIEFMREALISIDFKTKVDTIISQVNNGLLGEDAGRLALNQPGRYPQGEDVFRRPANIVIDGEEPEEDEGDESQKLAVTAAMNAVVIEAIDRMAKRISSQAKGHGDSRKELSGWLNGVAAEHRRVFQPVLSRALAPLALVRPDTPDGEKVASALLADLFGRITYGEPELDATEWWHGYLDSYGGHNGKA